MDCMKIKFFRSLFIIIFKVFCCSGQVGFGPRISVGHEEGGGGRRDGSAFPLLAGEGIEAVFKDIAFLCPFSSPGK